MKLTKEQKKEKAKELSATLKKTPHFFVAAYQGLKFQDLNDLRKLLKPLHAKCQILKNSVMGYALKDAKIEIPEAAEKALHGPNAVIIAGEDDPVAPAKVLVKFAKEFEKLKLKVGFVGGRWMGLPDCQKLGSRPELLGNLAGTLYSGVAQSAWVLAAPIQKLALVLKALEEKKKSAGAAA